jgi:Flp pilus assembly protein TadD
MLLVLALLWGASLVSCSTPQPEVPADQIARLLEQKKQAASLVQEALGKEGQREEQKKLYMKALELDPSLGQAYNNLGLLYLEDGDYGEAVRLLREAVKRMPGDPVPRFNLGYAYELVGRLESAEEHYEGAAKLSGDDPDYLECYARVLIRRREQFGRAEGLLRRALERETRPENVKWIHEQLEAMDKGFVS